MNRLALLLAGCALATGCIQTNDEFVLNPDGSGKVKHTAVFQPSTLNLDGQASNPAVQMKQDIAKELSDATGVEAWKDVSYERASDGRVRFWGTAYFRDVQTLRFHNGGFQSSSLVPAVTRTGDGMVLELSERKGLSPKGGSTERPANDAELEERVAAEKAKYQQMRRMMAGMLSTMKVEKSFQLPGKIADAGGMQTTPTGAVKATLDGAKMLEVLDQVVADDSWWRDLVRGGRTIQDPDPEMDRRFHEKVYGTTKPLRATVTGGLRPQFDYAGEVADAEQKYPAMLEGLKLPGGTGPAVAPVAGTTTFKSLKVGGIRLAYFADRTNDVRPLNIEPEYTIALVGELGGAVHDVIGGQILKAVTDTGESLLPEGAWDRKINFPRLSKDKATVTFEVKLKLPGAGAKGLKELSGQIEYLVAGTAKRVDLGVTEFKAGSAGKEYDAVIKSIEPSKWSKGENTLEVKVQLPKHAIKSVTLYDAAGSKLDVKPSGSMWSDNSSTLGFSMPGIFPERGRIELEVYEGSQKYAVPFTLTEISLLGQPMR